MGIRRVSCVGNGRMGNQACELREGGGGQLLHGEVGGSCHEEVGGWQDARRYREDHRTCETL